MIRWTDVFRGVRCALVTACVLSACKAQRGPTAAEADLQALLAQIPDMPAVSLDEEMAGRLIEFSLKCVDRELPNKPSHVFYRHQDVKPPRLVTPAFYGCFDWHSAVHGHWTLARIARLFPRIPQAARARKKLADHLTVKNLAAERDYFSEKRSALFERPYGWGWLLRLAAELTVWKADQAAAWRAALEPLTQLIVARAEAYLPRLSVPVRAGTHHSTAYAMVHMLDYAYAVGNESFAALLKQRARDFYVADRACPTQYEPSGEDFISPCLVEADLMRRVLPPQRFASWLSEFLPPLASSAFRPLREPTDVKDPEDPRIGHLIGLALQRSAAYAGIGGALPSSDPRRAIFQRLARAHLHAALAKMGASGYGGAHWLASFAVYALSQR